MIKKVQVGQCFSQNVRPKTNTLVHPTLPYIDNLLENNQEYSARLSLTLFSIASHHCES